MPEFESSSAEPGGPRDGRRLGGMLLLGMLTIPVICVWFFLRRGYAPSLRTAAFGYTAALTTIALIGRSA